MQINLQRWIVPSTSKNSITPTQTDGKSSEILSKRYIPTEKKATNYSQTNFFLHWKKILPASAFLPYMETASWCKTHIKFDEAWYNLVSNICNTVCLRLHISFFYISYRIYKHYLKTQSWKGKKNIHKYSQSCKVKRGSQKKERIKIMWEDEYGNCSKQGTEGRINIISQRVILHNVLDILGIASNSGLGGGWLPPNQDLHCKNERGMKV